MQMYYPSQIILKEDLNKVGVFKAEINFHSDVKSNISIKIDKIQSKITFPQYQKKVRNFSFMMTAFNLLSRSERNKTSFKKIR